MGLVIVCLSSNVEQLQSSSSELRRSPLHPLALPLSRPGNSPDPVRWRPGRSTGNRLGSVISRQRRYVQKDYELGDERSAVGKEEEGG